MVSQPTCTRLYSHVVRVNALWRSHIVRIFIIILFKAIEGANGDIGVFILLLLFCSCVPLDSQIQDTNWEGKDYGPKERVNKLNIESDFSTTKVIDLLAPN